MAVQEDERSLLKRELDILFYTLCDGLLQEVRQHYLVNLATGQDFSIIDEQEVGIASLLALHLRLVGFDIQLEPCFEGEDSKSRSDFRIWLPASQQNIYLEFKPIAWGSRGRQYDYQHAINDIEKLSSLTDQRNRRNGLIALGFNNPEKQQTEQLLQGFERLSQRITVDYQSYEEIGLRSIDFNNMDKLTSYAVIGMWFRKLS